MDHSILLRFKTPSCPWSLIPPPTRQLANVGLQSWKGLTLWKFQASGHRTSTLHAIRSTFTGGRGCGGCLFCSCRPSIRPRQGQTADGRERRLLGFDRCYKKSSDEGRASEGTWNRRVTIKILLGRLAQTRTTYITAGSLCGCVSPIDRRDTDV